MRMKANQQQWIVEFTINAGKLEEFKQLAKKIAKIVEKNEPDTRAYQWYLSHDGKKCIVSELYAGSRAAIAHIQGRGATVLLPKLLKIAKITRFEVYGNEDEEVMKALAEFGAKYFHSLTGFTRTT